MRTDWQVNVRQTYNIPLMEVSRCTTQSLTVNTGQYANVTIYDGKGCTVLTLCINDIVRIMNNLVIILHSLIDIVVDSVLCQLTNKAVDTCVTDEVNCLGITVSTHNGVDVAKDFRCHLLGNVDNVCRSLILQQVFEYLCLLGFESCHCILVESGCQCTANLFHLTSKVVVVANFVVHVQCRNHCKANGIGLPYNSVQCGRILCICNDTRTRVADGYVAVIIDDWNLYGVANARKGTVAQVRTDD